MRGIKECVNWMLDNPMKEIKSEEYGQVRRFNNKYTPSFIESRYINDGESISNWSKLKAFGGFEDGDDWEEVKQPYTFLEAYEECENNKVDFINKHNVIKIEYDKVEKHVYIRTVNGKNFGCVGWAVGKSTWFKKED